MEKEKIILKLSNKTFDIWLFEFQFLFEFLNKYWVQYWKFYITNNVLLIDCELKNKSFLNHNNFNKLLNHSVKDIVNFGRKKKSISNWSSRQLKKKFI